MKIYGVKVYQLGADDSRTLYFRNEENAIACQNAYQRADDIINFEADDFPLDMLNDCAF